MSNFAVLAEGLSKSYRIEATRGRRRRRGRLFDSASAWVQDAIQRPFGGHKQRKFETLWAVRDLSFEIGHGDPVGIIGANGAGKTTLLKILARITAPTEGRARMRGRVGSLLEVGTAFHSELTGRENVFLNGAVLGMRGDEVGRKFDAIVDFSGVEDFIDTPLKFYSSGMRMRLAFSVAAHLEPEILLVDEVLAVGDVAFQNKCLNKMQEVTTAGRTVLFVSHNLGAVKALCPQCMYLEHGRMKFLGDTATAIQQYLQSRESAVPQDASVASWRESQILSVMPCDSEGKSMRAFAHDGPLYVRIRVHIGLVGFKSHLTLRVHSANLETVLVTHDFEPDGESLLPPRPGICEFEVQLPGGLLAPGRYYLGAELFQQMQNTRFRRMSRLDHVGEFDVFDNGSLLSRLNIPWQGLVQSQAITWSRLDGEDVSHHSSPGSV